MTKLLKAVPFIMVIFINIIAQASRFYTPVITPFLYIVIGVLSINLLLNTILKSMDYFTLGISSVAITGILLTLFTSSIGDFYLRNIIGGLYLGLFLISFFPPLFKLEPFTFAFSKRSYSDAITNGKQFLKINLILNYMWAIVFALCIALSTITYSSDNSLNMALSTGLPFIIQLLIALPLTIFLPSFLMERISGDRLHFNSIVELFNSMPMGLNKKKIVGVNIVVQFNLTGVEPTMGYLKIAEQKCTYTKGEHTAPTVTINSDSTLWLEISNGEKSGDKAFINKEYSVHGDASIMLDFDSYFSSEKPKKIVKRKQVKKPTLSYKTFEPDRIKNIIIFDGGPRKSEYSKTTFMVNSFILGAEEAGASVEYIKLKDYKINSCSGCYHCWTKTPGKCIYSDDMPILMKKYRDADLVIFSSPLYIFNVTGIMKTFMDRLLPLMKPYMLMDQRGQILHPDRFPEKGEQGFIVFSAAGFPEVEHNFDGLIGMYRCWNSHSENAHLMGEFYLPSAEMLVQPVYKKRREEVQSLCYSAGLQIIKEGRIDPSIMLKIQEPLVAKELFQSQADNFWESLDGIQPYMTTVPKL